MNGGISIGVLNEDRKWIFIGWIWLIVMSTQPTWVWGVTHPPDDGEVRMFLQDFDRAGKLCDMDWYQQHLLPTATISYSAPNKSFVYMADEWIQGVRDICIPGYFYFPIFDQTSYVFSMQADRTYVEFESAKGDMSFYDGPLRVLDLKPRDVQSVRNGFVLVRDEDGRVKLAEEYVDFRLIPKQPFCGRMWEWSFEDSDGPKR